VLRWLDCAERNPKRTEVVSARLLRRTRKDGAAPGDLEPVESGGCNCSGELCFQQSTGDSTRPEVALALYTLGDRALYEDVGDLKPATWP
jgi:hypothetical protein